MAKQKLPQAPTATIKEKFAEISGEIHSLKAEVLILTNIQTTLKQQMKAVNDNLLLAISNGKRLTNLYDSNFKRIQKIEDKLEIKATTNLSKRIKNNVDS